MSDEELEKDQEQKQEKQDMMLMRECIDDARKIVFEKRLLESQSAITKIAVALFEARVKK
jgi:hypothetical protein